MLDAGLISTKSRYTVKETVDRLIAKLSLLSLKVFARIDHAEGATAVGMKLRPTELLIIGNAKGGTPLMQEQQTCGIDLPLKILAWEDDAKQVWVTYNDPAWIADRHGLSEQSQEPLANMAAAIKKLLAAADI